MSSTKESLIDLLLSLLAIIIKIIIIVLPAGIHPSGKVENYQNLLECQKPDSSEIPGEVIGTVAFIKGKETKYAKIKTNGDNCTLVCENGNMSFDKTIEQLQLFSKSPLFIEGCTTFKIVLNTGNIYIYGKHKDIYVGNELNNNNVMIGYMHNINIEEPLF